nr:unnamed protein product [Spirometra erinaceieuropaei]
MSLNEDGLMLDAGDRTLRFRLASFICDAPARAFIKQIKNVNAYFACERCCVKEEYIDKIVYDSVSEHARTDERAAKIPSAVDIADADNLYALSLGLRSHKLSSLLTTPSKRAWSRALIAYCKPPKAIWNGKAAFRCLTKVPSRAG